VLRLVAAGHTNREVAERLSISANTVKFHMRGILDKLHLRNRSEVTAWAANHRRGGSAKEGT
jgi:DNA-binding CsgD family transcriptional regulator